MTASTKFVAFALVVVAIAPACIDGWDLEARKFPCRVPDDCVEGFECHPTDFICVVTGTATVAPSLRDVGEADVVVAALDAEPPSDAGTSTISDAGTGTIADAGMGPSIGDECDDRRPCVNSACVDGYCCESRCEGTCRRCDVIPGRCTFADDGTDPDNDCAGDTQDCRVLLFGLRDGACLSCQREAVDRGGTCNGAGQCRPDCACAQPRAAPVSMCRNADCVRANACRRFGWTADFDSTEELCAIGQTCNAVLAGCCSAEGACCPAPACDGADLLCR